MYIFSCESPNFANDGGIVACAKREDKIVHFSSVYDVYLTIEKGLTLTREGMGITKRVGDDLLKNNCKRVEKIRIVYYRTRAYSDRKKMIVSLSISRIRLFRCS